MRCREFGSLCLAPVVMVGYLMGTDFHFKSSHRDTTVPDAGFIELQSCDRGFGVDGKASSAGLYGVDLQYGFQWAPTEDTTITLTPKVGISYADHPIKELPQRTQFGLGGAVTVGYHRFRVGVELWHLSNGKDLGMAVSEKAKHEPNIGLNMLAVTAGWVF
jgi:hypothetical protein